MYKTNGTRGIKDHLDLYRKKKTVQHPKTISMTIAKILPILGTI